MMNKLTFGFLLILGIQVLNPDIFGQAPDHLSYQAVIRNGNGELVSGKPVGIRIQIKEGSEFGAAIYVETHVAETNENGLVSLEIGGGTPVLGIFTSIDWANGPYFLLTETDPAGGTNYSINGGMQILSVPYALYAKTAANGFSGDYNDLKNKPDVPVLNDTLIAGNTVWSSAKTNTELNKKANSSEVYTKNDLQTSGKSSVHYNNIINKPDKLDEDGSDDVTITGDQTVSGNKDFTGRVSVAIPENSSDAANKAYVDLLKSQLKELQAQLGVTDADGNHYQTVMIGNQIWMAENLKTSKYNDGTDITNITDSSLWYNTTSPAFCWFKNDKARYKDLYGGLYNGYTVTTGKVCPSGWHVPSNHDWALLYITLGGSEVAGGKMKEAGTSHWAAPNTGADNSSGFNGVPTAYRDLNFYVSDYKANWWSTQEAYSGRELIVFELESTSSELIQSIKDYEEGINIRCIQDNVVPSSEVPHLTTASPGLNITESANSGGNIFSDGGSAVKVRGVCWSKNHNPDLTADKTTDGGGVGRYSSKISGLKPNTTYYVRAYATNIAGTGYGDEQVILTLPTIQYDSVSDIEGKVYKTVTIGRQIWMAENLRTTRFNDGTAIPKTSNASVPGIYYVNPAFGAYYNWYAVETEKLCPSGWHVPSQSDWGILSSFLAGKELAGGKLKEAGKAHWPAPNTGSENRTGFTALPGGGIVNGTNGDVNTNAFWWSATEYSEDQSSIYFISNCCTFLDVFNSGKSSGYNVRCLNDSLSRAPELPVVTTKAVHNIKQTAAISGGIVHLEGDSAVKARGVCWSTSPDPGLSNHKTNDGKGAGSFDVNISGLYANTTYYLRAYATNSAGTAFGEEFKFTTAPEASEPVTDVDSNNYQTVYIGNQQWMSENLEATHLNDGTAIQLIENGNTWKTKDIPAYCWYLNQEKLYKHIYGALYNGFTVNSAKICPTGWHVPADNEWLQLISYLGGDEVAGGKLKGAGNAWDNNNPGTDNSSHFSALPGGYRSTDGSYLNIGTDGWWSSTDSGGIRLISSKNKVYLNGPDVNNTGKSIRCIADREYKTAAELPSLTTTLVSNIIDDKAVSGGMINSEGGAEVIARGICWSTLHNPDITDSKTTDGNGPGGFTSTMSGLDCNYIYYVRAYATNAAGTGYGNEVAFESKGKCLIIYH